MVASVVGRSPAAAKGLERGDVVLAVNNVKVRTLDDISKAVENAYSRSSLVLSVLRDPYVYNLTFGLE
jgi:S1-C subfamily serine protease